MSYQNVLMSDTLENFHKYLVRIAVWSAHVIQEKLQTFSLKIFILVCYTIQRGISRFA